MGCSGINARVAEKDVMLHTAEGGSVTTFLRSRGVGTLITPVGEANTGWQHCSGLMVAKADKSASASGICYRVSLKGDQETISWQFDGDSRTWKRESGTGESSGAASGTWEWAVQMGNGLGINSWKGTASNRAVISLVAGRSSCASNGQCEPHPSRPPLLPLYLTGTGQQTAPSSIGPSGCNL